jgi:uncharacterized membrane protein YeaQ/YmgE (transglycosylase-associated protein family)
MELPMPTMDQISAYWPFIIMVVNGMIAGWLAGQILGGGGLLRNLIVGIIGAFLGGVLVKAGLLNLPASVTNITNTIPYGTQITVSTIGALLVILIARFLGRS